MWSFSYHGRSRLMIAGVIFPNNISKLPVARWFTIVKVRHFWGFDVASRCSDCGRPASTPFSLLRTWINIILFIFAVFSNENSRATRCRTMEIGIRMISTETHSCGFLQYGENAKKSCQIKYSLFVKMKCGEPPTTFYEPNLSINQLTSPSTSYINMIWNLKGWIVTRSWLSLLLRNHRHFVWVQNVKTTHADKTWALEKAGGSLI